MREARAWSQCLAAPAHLPLRPRPPRTHAHPCNGPVWMRAWSQCPAAHLPLRLSLPRVQARDRGRVVPVCAQLGLQVLKRKHVARGQLIVLWRKWARAREGAGEW